MRATFAPLERFRKVGGRVQLRYGDLTIIAEQTGKTTGHISRVISGDRPSEALAARIKDIVGVPVDKIDLPRRAKSAA